MVERENSSSLDQSGEMEVNGFKRGVCVCVCVCTCACIRTHPWHMEVPGPGIESEMQL